MFKSKKAVKIGSKTVAAEGFSLIEATIALTTLGVCLAYAMPLFLYSKMNNVKSEVRTGALMVSQQIFDDLRGLPFQNLPAPSITAQTIRPDGTIVGSPGSDTIPRNTYNMMNRTYTAKVFHCEVAADCDANYKTFHVQVLDRNNQIVYEMEAGFTNFR
jgi:Tfp pilus assembly protein PilV